MWCVYLSFNKRSEAQIMSPFCSLSTSDQITHPAGCMSQFIRFFGEQIMVLWKFALLRKRILIFSPPPVGVVCYRGERKLIYMHVTVLMSMHVFHNKLKIAWESIDTDNVQWSVQFYSL